MLHDTSWINRGQEFPPTSEIARLTLYRKNKMLYDGRTDEVYKQHHTRLDSRVADPNELTFPQKLTYQRKISLKVSDFLFMEPPKISGDTDAEKTMLTELLKTNDIKKLGRMGAIDTSRYGTAVLKITKPKDDTAIAKISIVPPQHLFIVVDPMDIKTVIAYVIAFAYESNGIKYASFEVHTKGYRENVTFKIRQSGRLGLKQGKAIKLPTGLTDFAIVPIQNVETSDSVYGDDDYQDIDTLVPELEIRKAQMSRILDKFADPMLQGDISALKREIDGSYVFYGGNFYNRKGKDGTPLEYVVWDAAMESHFSHMNGIKQDIGDISEMGAAIFNDYEKMGNVPSGEALKRLYINVLAKVARVRENFDTALKKALALASEITPGATLTADKISITWGDGLPNDKKEQAEIMQMRSANSRTKPTKEMLMEFDGLSEADAETQAAAIEEESAGDMQVIPPDPEPIDDEVDDENDE